MIAAVIKCAVISRWWFQLFASSTIQSRLVSIDSFVWFKSGKQFYDTWSETHSFSVSLLILPEVKQIYDTWYETHSFSVSLSILPEVKQLSNYEKKVTIAKSQ